MGGDPWESRTPVCGVRGRRLNHLTNGPFLRRRVSSLRAPSKLNNVNFASCLHFLLLSRYESGWSQKLSAVRLRKTPAGDFVPSGRFAPLPS